MDDKDFQEDNFAELSIEGENNKKEEPEQKTKKSSSCDNKNTENNFSPELEIKSKTVVSTSYNSLGEKLVMEGYKDGRIKKSTEYYAGGFLKSVTNYDPSGSYTITTYNISGSKESFVQKYKDGTSEAIYFNVDAEGSNVIIKFDKDQNPVEKRTEKN